MKWDEEVFVKIYVRDTPEFLAMSWQARCLLHELIRKADRAGVLKVGKLGVRGLALAIQAPVEEIERPVAELVMEERLVWKEDAGLFLIPNHVEAQVARQTDATRKRRERAQGKLPYADPSHTGQDARTSCPRGSDPVQAADTNADTRTSCPEPTDAGHAEDCHTGSDTRTSCPERSDAVQAPDAPQCHTGSDTRTSCPERSDSVRAVDIMSPKNRLDQNRLDQIRVDERERERARARTTLTPIDPERKLGEEGHAYAETLGVQDIERVYRDFRNHYLAEAKVSADWEALWRRWCDRELRIQGQERQRARGGVRTPAQVDPPGQRAWTMPPVIRLPRGRVS